jgi:hypothetical protein
VRRRPSYAGARDRAALPDPHFILTPAAHAYLEAPMPKEPSMIDIASVAPSAPRRSVAHHVRRAAYVSSACLVALGVLCLTSAALMVGVYLALHHR